jgi:zinc and cadmium transporter
MAGALLTDNLTFLVTHGLALSAGVTIYVAASDLVPEFQHKKGWKIPSLFFVGAAVEFGAKELLQILGG